MNNLNSIECINSKNKSLKIEIKVENFKKKKKEKRRVKHSLNKENKVVQKWDRLRGGERRKLAGRWSLIQRQLSAFFVIYIFIRVWDISGNINGKRSIGNSFNWNLQLNFWIYKNLKNTNKQGRRGHKNREFKTKYRTGVFIKTN